MQGRINCDTLQSTLSLLILAYRSDNLCLRVVFEPCQNMSKEVNTSLTHLNSLISCWVYGPYQKLSILNVVCQVRDVLKHKVTVIRYKIILVNLNLNQTSLT